MATGIVERTDGFEDAAAPSSLPNPTSTLVAMVACNVILLVMLAACSPPAHAEDLAPQRSREGADLRVAVPLERLVVTPSPEDRSAPVKTRWQRSDDAPNAAPRSRGYRVAEATTNDGVRVACYEPRFIGCCTSSGRFSLAASGVGR